mmetsp:Transcript_19129/g.49002  ORF Transcript_19129/g.49002 Transcript_19129/m.49002 type:complete len:212 (-) Transcript_19129:250-885(-)
MVCDLDGYARPMPRRASSRLLQRQVEAHRLAVVREVFERDEGLADVLLAEAVGVEHLEHECLVKRADVDAERLVPAGVQRIAHDLRLRVPFPQRELTEGVGRPKHVHARQVGRTQKPNDQQPNVLGHCLGRLRLVAARGGGDDGEDAVTRGLERPHLVLGADEALQLRRRALRLVRLDAGGQCGLQLCIHLRIAERAHVENLRVRPRVDLE